ncbi:hypothetical protein FJY63_02180 [Candidatus Sumerlaeota bacterium]|nr:hypothetical protein [Candidatus Sumerlaeota bacterium]
MTAHRNSRSSSVSEEPQEAEQTWRDPAAKLLELGSHKLKQVELLAILIGSGVPGRSALAIATAVLEQYLSLYDIHRKGTVEDLTRVPGVGRDKAGRIMAAIELGRKLYRLWQLQRPQKPAPKADDDLIGDLSAPPEPAPPPPEGPSDAELLAAIIGSGIRDRPPKVIAEDLLARFGGSFRGLFGQDLGDWLPVKGLNSTKIIRICAALQVAARVARAIAW